MAKRSEEEERVDFWRNGLIGWKIMQRYDTQTAACRLAMIKVLIRFLLRNSRSEEITLFSSSTTN
jgi:hypothetical protein